MSPIRDPRSRTARRLTRMAARLESGKDEPPAARRPPRQERADGGEERPLLQAADALEADWDDLPTRAKHGRRGAVERKRAARAPIAAAREAAGDAAAAAVPPAGEALVVATTRGPCEVELDDGHRATAELPKALARAERSEVAVGDRVELARRPGGELVVARVLPRRSRLSRPDPFHAHRERVLAANLDLAVVVASVRRPPLSTGLVDRFLVALAHGGVDAVLAVNKIDLLSGPERDPRSDPGRDPELRALEPYRRLGLQVVLCSALDGSGTDELRRRIAGRTVALVGHSGVGKSSLLNAIAPGTGAAVGEVAVNARGRHTTTSARVYRQADGTRIVDTPGVREFGLWRLTAAELTRYFPEFEPFAAACRFGDCSHRHEPDCAVRAAASGGEIAAERFATYLRILDSLDGA